MRSVWLGFLLALTLAACNLEGSPPVSGDLPVGDHEIAQLPPAQKGPGDELRPGVAVYRIPLTSDGAVRISAVSSELELSARLRLVLLDEKGVVQAVSVARNWFAARQELTPLALRPQITTDPGFRLNFRGQAGQVFYLRVENYALSADRVTLYADAFTPDSQGQGESFTFGTKVGAIEFVGEFDRYNVASATGYLRLTYSGPLDLVALLYNGPNDAYPRKLDPVVNCAPIAPATLLVVRDRGLARAGFDEPLSGRYTLEISDTPCPQAFFELGETRLKVLKTFLIQARLGSPLPDGVIRPLKRFQINRELPDEEEASSFSASSGRPRHTHGRYAGFFPFALSGSRHCGSLGPDRAQEGHGPSGHGLHLQRARNRQHPLRHRHRHAHPSGGLGGEPRPSEGPPLRYQGASKRPGVRPGAG